uniref:Uncharacterized protein n=1 Tax=Oryza rufipogon TaxID=4529 RepID=A0A0E0QUK0_ORYRU
MVWILEQRMLAWAHHVVMQSEVEIQEAAVDELIQGTSFGMAKVCYENQLLLALGGKQQLAEHLKVALWMDSSFGMALLCYKNQLLLALEGKQELAEHLKGTSFGMAKVCYENQLLLALGGKQQLAEHLKVALWMDTSFGMAQLCYESQLLLAFEGKQQLAEHQKGTSFGRAKVCYENQLLLALGGKQQLADNLKIKNQQEEAALPEEPWETLRQYQEEEPILSETLCGRSGAKPCHEGKSLCCQC